MGRLLSVCAMVGLKVSVAVYGEGDLNDLLRDEEDFESFKLRMESMFSKYTRGQLDVLGAPGDRFGQKFENPSPKTKLWNSRFRGMLISMMDGERYGQIERHWLVVWLRGLAVRILFRQMRMRLAVADGDSDSALNFEEFREDQKASKFETDDIELAKLRFELLDVNKDERISPLDLYELHQLIQNNIYVDKEIEFMFKRHDLNEDGVLNIDEWKNITCGVLGDTFFRLSDPAVHPGPDKGFRLVDRDGDGLVDRVEMGRSLALALSAESAKHEAEIQKLAEKLIPAAAPQHWTIAAILSNATMAHEWSLSELSDHGNFLTHPSFYAIDASDLQEEPDDGELPSILTKAASMEFYREDARRHPVWGEGSTDETEDEDDRGGDEIRSELERTETEL